LTRRSSMAVHKELVFLSDSASAGLVFPPSGLHVFT
jgi:hypothetical protein